MQRAASGALLLGRLFDDRGNRMTPSTAKKGAIRYRYYVSSVLAQGRHSEAGAVRRVSAPDIEAFVVEVLRRGYPEAAGLDERTLIGARVQRIVLGAGSIDIHPDTDPGLRSFCPGPPLHRGASARSCGPPRAAWSPIAV